MASTFDDLYVSYMYHIWQTHSPSVIDVPNSIDRYRSNLSDDRPIYYERLIPQLKVLPDCLTYSIESVPPKGIVDPDE